jgi:hypothetical protein
MRPFHQQRDIDLIGIGREQLARFFGGYEPASRWR